MLKLISSKNKVVAVRQFVHTLCIFSFTDVTPRELDLLCEILRCGGVNEDAKKSFILNYRTSKENYGQLVKRLGDKGILINLDNRTGKKMHPYLTQMLEEYINSDKTTYLWLEWNVES